jgi:hypothetical protein
MTLQEHTLEYVDGIYDDMVGGIILVTKTTIKKRWWWFDKKIVKHLCFWRPIQTLLNKEQVKYTEYGKTRFYIGNAWFQIIINDTTPDLINGFPDLEQLSYYPISRVIYKTKLWEELTMFYSTHLLPF